MIISWPDGIKNKGNISSQVGHVMDFMATFLELAGADYPQEYKGNKITPLEGKSFAQALKGKKSTGRKALFNEHEGSKYVRYENWKLVIAEKSKNWQLYDILKDPLEAENLAAQYPDKVNMLQKMWEDWANKHFVK